MDPIVTGAAANLASDATKGILQEVKRHVRYLIKQKENVDKFEEKMKSLIAKRESVQQEVNAAERNVETIKEDVKFWCQQVDEKIGEEVKKVEDLEEKAKAKCFIRLCPNIKSRYKLSRKAEEGVAAFDELLQQCRFDRVAVRDLPPAPINAAPKNFKAFDSRKEVFQEIMEALKDSTINMIGVYGVGGVGKTTLVNEVVRQVEEDRSFSSVVKAEVTRTPNIEKIQDQIAESLGSKLEERSKENRAKRLLQRLKKENKVLIVLDDLWEGLNLEEVGIALADQHNECKILLTSRNRDVLKNEMDAERTFPVGVVKEEEAWELFKEMAGNGFVNPELKSVATEVAERCAGLPLAIATVARALKNKDLSEWKDACLQLQRPSPENFTGIPKAVYSAIELSYNCLASEKLRHTFLLSCLLGNNAHIQDLLRCAMGLHLFDGLNTVEEARNRIATMVRKLKDCCLLLDSSNEDRITMHDFVCDVALAIASRDNHAFILKRGDVFEDWADEEKMKEFKWISLSFASINKLPHELEWPQLSLFSLGSTNEDSYAEMATSFYGKMKKIKVLKLTKMDFRSLPSPLSLPTSLRTLCLEECWMGDMVNLGKLQSLEILSLSGSDVEMLPKEMGQLKMLRLLDLSYCTSLSIISPGVLSSLSSLEELYTSGIIVPWNQPNNARLDELKELSGLITLHIQILEAKIVPKGLFSEKLQRYKILIGGEWDWHDKVEYSRTLKLRVNTSIDDLDHGFKHLLKKAEALSMENLEGIRIVLNQLGNRDCFLHLKHLHIRNASDIQYIINDDIDDAIDKIAFRSLRSMTLENLPQLISFCFSKNRTEGSTSLPQHELPLFGEQMELPCLQDLCLSSINVGSVWHKQFSTLENLTSLIIQGCGNLKYIFSSSMATSLVHFKSFEIVDCESLREIIFTEDIQEENEVTISFPQLSTLKMKNLPHLIGYCSENYKIVFPSLWKLEIEQCPEFKGLIIYKSATEEYQPHCMPAVFNRKVVCPNLEELILISVNVQRVWPDPHCYVQSLKWLVVKNCHNLRSLFASSMMPLLTQLKVIVINDCENVEEVISQGVTEEEILPNLTTLQLIDLPRLLTFCHGFGSYLEFPLMNKLLIYNCPALKTFISDSVVANETQSFEIEFPPLFNEKVAFPQLEYLSLSKLENCTKIWHDQLVGDSFSKLNKLLLLKCNRLENVFPFNMSKRLQNLEVFKINSCDLLKEIFGPHQVLNANEIHGQTATQSIEETAPHFVFPKLTFLQFMLMPGLKSFYSGIHTTEWPSLKKMVVCRCGMVEIFASDSQSFGELENRQPLFWVDKVTFPNLEELELDWNDTLRKIWHGQLRADAFSKLRVLENLTALEVSRCHGLVNLLSCSAARSLVQLTRMSITDCDKLVEIIAGEGDEVKGSIIFTHLKYLQLSCLRNLASFCLGKHDFEFPALEKVIVIGCPDMKIFSNGYLSTPMLQRVQFIKSEDEGCWEGNLNSTTEWLFAEKVGYRGLEHLELSDSSEFTEIWRQNPQEMLDLKNLKSLKFYECSALTCLFSLSMALELAQLLEIKVKNCTMMKHIILDEGANEEVDNKIIFPLLTTINLESCANLSSFYHGNKILEFPSLEELYVVDCPRMFAFASTFSRERTIESIDDGGNTTKLSKEAMDVSDGAFFNSKVVCINLETVELSSVNVERVANETHSSDIEFPPLFNEKVEFPQLEELGLGLLDNFTKIWHDQLVGDSFSKLNVLLLFKCNRLEYVFPFNMSKRLWNLEVFKVGFCDSLKEIIGPQVLNAYELHGLTATQSIEEISPHFVFPKLTVLEFGGLPMKSFYCGIHTTEWPSLKKMEVTFPKLEELKLEWNDILRIVWHGQLRADFFSKLRVVELLKFPDTRAVFPHCFIRSLPNLEKLVVSDAAFAQIFSLEGFGGEEKDALALTSLNELSLARLPRLTHLWKEEYNLSRAFCELRSLQVLECHNLKTLVPSLASFENLTALEVSKCHGLVKLIACSTAKSLVQLTRMSIIDCDKIKEIIGGDGDEVKGCIVFTQLKYLQLSCLPSLYSFCLRDHHVFEFPALEKLIVRGCPKMRIFCQGDLSTPQLQKLMLTEDEENGRWDGDLKTTIKQLFEEMVRH
ncbi:hypothetical protein PTKIN_Ptkin06aG0198200 [Pterospermum kingtungense]